MTIQTLAIEHVLIKQAKLLADMIAVKAGKIKQHAGILSSFF